MPLGHDSSSFIANLPHRPLPTSTSASPNPHATRHHNSNMTMVGSRNPWSEKQTNSASAASASPIPGAKVGDRSAQNGYTAPGNSTVVLVNTGVRTRPNPLRNETLRTGVCYDARMRFHATIDEEEMHPEDPRRIYEIYSALCQADLIDDPGFTGVIGGRDLMKGIRAREITKEEVMLVHHLKHWDFLEKTAGLQKQDLQRLSRDGDSVYFNSESFFCAKLSCGGAVETCMAVMAGEVKNAVAIVRPPGHHAEPEKAMGFCLFNNVCVAARAVQKKFPETCRKVLILDWDVHHGNGTQTTFYDDPTVMYMSIHRYEDGRFYPDGPEGNLDHCGSGAGVGMNVNIPWASGGLGDGDYMYAFQRVIMPIAMEFCPDLVIVSAGFDAAAGDTLGGCFVTPAGFAHMTHMLMCLAGGKIAVCLEGGYNLKSISKSAVAVTKTLMGDPPGKLHLGDTASKGAVEVINKCVIQQSRFWRSMKPREAIPPEMYTELDLPAIRLNDVVRSYQASKLWELFRMAPLHIFRDRISESFKNQVVATSDYDNKETLFFLVHDPPPVTALPDPLTNRIALHNSYLIDAGLLFVSWAAKQGFGIIDANIPLMISGNDNADYDACRQTEELCVYLWDNYLEVSSAKNIIIMGVGEAVTGIVHLLTQRDCRDRVKACVSFVADNTTLRAVPSNHVMDNLNDWYYQNSMVFVSHDHAVWSRAKVRKKFGFLKECRHTHIHDIMKSSEQATEEWIMSKIDA